LAGACFAYGLASLSLARAEMGPLSKRPAEPLAPAQTVKGTGFSEQWTAKARGDSQHLDDCVIFLALLYQEI
jgi:hypothetical protein